MSILLWNYNANTNRNTNTNRIIQIIQIIQIDFFINRTPENTINAVLHGQFFGFHFLTTFLKAATLTNSLTLKVQYLRF